MTKVRSSTTARFSICGKASTGSARRNGTWPGSRRPQSAWTSQIVDETRRGLRRWQCRGRRHSVLKAMGLDGLEESAALRPDDVRFSGQRADGVAHGFHRRSRLRGLDRKRRTRRSTSGMRCSRAGEAVRHHGRWAPRRWSTRASRQASSQAFIDFLPAHVNCSRRPVAIAARTGTGLAGRFQEAELQWPARAREREA